MILYKYFPPERVSILKDFFIKFTQPSEFNDTFEVMPYINKKNIDLEKIFNSIISLFDKEKIVKEYYEDSGFLNESHQEILNSLKESFIEESINYLRTFPIVQKKIISLYTVILSLSEEYDNILMWAHYSKNNEGFVIGLDSDTEFFDKPKIKIDNFKNLVKVEYVDKRIEIDICLIIEWIILLLYSVINRNNNIYDKIIKENLENLNKEIYLKKILSVKSKEWEYEKEWRVFKPLLSANKVDKNNDKMSFLYKVPIECLKEIIIGNKCTLDFENEIIKSIISNNEFQSIKVFKLVESDNEYKFERKEILFHSY